MGPLQAASAVTGCHLMQYPSKRWGFVGNVPEPLCYVRLDGAPLTPQDAADLRHVGPGFLKKRIRSVAFDTREQAIAAARALGIEPDGA